MLKERIKAMKEQIRRSSRNLRCFGESPLTLASRLVFPSRQVCLRSGLELSVTLQKLDFIDQMVAIENLAYHGVSMWSCRDFYDDMVYNSGSFYLMAFRDGELVAFIGCHLTRGSVHISNFVVHPRYQSQGLGHYLFACVVELLPQLDRQSISLEVRRSNHKARRFYEREGFRKIGTKPRYYRNNREDAINMAWYLEEQPDSCQSVQGGKSDDKNIIY